MRSVIPCLMLTACAAQGGEDGGGANLPGRGIAGYQPASEGPVLSVDPPGEIGGPTLLVGEGGQVTVWFHRADAGVVSIYRAAATAPTAGAPFVFGEATRVREGARDPSLIPAPDGDGLLMAYASPGGLSLARVVGDTFVDLDVDLPEGAAPSLVNDEGQLILYAVSEGALVASFEDAPFAFEPPVTVLSPGTDCTSLAGEPEVCWDAGPIADAEVRLARTVNGRKVWRALYAARKGSSGAFSLGFAASYDGVTFSRYAFNPFLDGKSYTAPASARLGASYHLLVEQRLGPGRAQIDHFISTPDAPADIF